MIQTSKKHQNNGLASASSMVFSHSLEIASALSLFHFNKTMIVWLATSDIKVAQSILFTSLIVAVMVARRAVVLA